MLLNLIPPSRIVFRWFLAIVILVSIPLYGCNSTTQKRTQNNIVALEVGLSEDNQLLDIAISPLDSGEDNPKETVFPEIRRAEAKYIPQMLKKTLQAQKSWGVVRLVPNTYDPMDLHVSGEILSSDGETLKLWILVQDATGHTWIKKAYIHKADFNAYKAGVSTENEPFQTLYNEIANDMLKLLQQISPSQRKFIRTISELRFAKEFEPQVFADYLREGATGTHRLIRLPPKEDPNLRRIRQIRVRNSMFIDILQSEYGNYFSEINTTYYEWRKESFKEKIMYRNAMADSQNLIFKGAVQAFRSLNPFTLFKLILNPTEQIGAGVAARQIQLGLDKRNDVKMHQEAIRELNASLNDFVRSHNVSIDERTINLTGTVDERYEQFRQILHEIYFSEQRLDPISE